MKNDAVKILDDETAIVFLHCPGQQIVLLQANFEIYEDIGVVRTIDVRTSQVCIVTTKYMLDDCLAVLEGLKEQIQFSFNPDATKGLQDEQIISRIFNAAKG